jgi:putative ABC transport system permease protein
LTELRRNLEYAVRPLVKPPGFTASVLLTLSLTIAVSTAIFSVIYAVLIRPLPYDQPDRIFHLQTYSPQGYSQPASYPEYLDWRRQNHVFSALAAYNDYGNANFEGPSGALSLNRVASTDNFFDVFGVAALLGRTFAPGEDQPGKNDVVVLSYEVWKEQFAGTRDVIGKIIRIDARPYTVIGVMPAGFRYPITLRNAIYTPLHITRKENLEARGNHWLPTIAHLKPGVSVQQAEADMARVLDDLGKAYPNDDKGRRMHLQDIAGFIVGDAGAPLKVLLLSVLALLLIGCANIAGLLLARGVKREREIALRSVLGASRAQIVGQLLSEAIVLAVLGGFAGILLSYALLGAMRVLLADALNRGAEVTINLPVMLAALAMALLATLAAAAIPSLRISTVAPNAALKSGGAAGASRGQHRLRRGFVITQIALAMVLLITSGLLLRTLAGLRGANLGFSPDHLLDTAIQLSPEAYNGRDAWSAFYLPLLDRVNAIPGVQAAGLIHMLPLREWGWNGDEHIVGQPPNPPNEERLAEIRLISPGYFDAMGISLLKGRLLDTRIDTASSQPAMVVNEAFVKKFFPNGGDPIGQHIDDFDKAQIVGVVRDVRQDLYQPPMAEMDFGIAQIPSAELLGAIPKMHLVVRTRVGPAAIAPALRGILRDLDPGVPALTVQTMRNVIDDVLTFERLENWLFGIFAGLAMLLSMVGLYALINHEVELSTRDIGVRMALGATRRDVAIALLRRVGLMLFCGVLAGLFLTKVAQKLISAVVVIQPIHDVAVIFGLALALVITGLIAVCAPARRAASVDPMVALRYE